MDVQKMQKELEHLLSEVHWLQQKLKNLPEENISCERDKQYIRWYLISEGKRNYLPRSQEKLANKLMQKKYYLTRLKDDLDEIAFLKKCLKTAPPTRRIDKLLSPDSSYHDLLLSQPRIKNDGLCFDITDEIIVDVNIAFLVIVHAIAFADLNFLNQPHQRGTV